MLKSQKLLLVSLLSGVALVACNGGNNNATQFLPQGTYSVNGTITSGTCTIESGTAVSDGAGQFCTTSASSSQTCSTLNLTNNPCATLSPTSGSNTATTTLSSCVFNSSTNVLTANLGISVNTTPVTTCAGTITITKTN
jgi:hypothetical protein